jgi:hypothetical protein
MDIGTEELSHLEIVGTLALMHLKPLKLVREAAEADPLIAIARGKPRMAVYASARSLLTAGSAAAIRCCRRRSWPVPPIGPVCGDAMVAHTDCSAQTVQAVQRCAPGTRHRFGESPDQKERVRRCERIDLCS